MFVFVWVFIPETKGSSYRRCLSIESTLMLCLISLGLSLEKMDDLFGVTDLVEKKIGAAELDIIDRTQREKAAETHVEDVERHRG
jgi:hypothetical protein